MSLPRRNRTNTFLLEKQVQPYDWPPSRAAAVSAAAHHSRRAPRASSAARWSKASTMWTGNSTPGSWSNSTFLQPSSQPPCHGGVNRLMGRPDASGCRPRLMRANAADPACVGGSHRFLSKSGLRVAHPPQDKHTSSTSSSTDPAASRCSCDCAGMRARAGEIPGSLDASLPPTRQPRRSSSTHGTRTARPDAATR